MIQNVPEAIAEAEIPSDFGEIPPLHYFDFGRKNKALKWGSLYNRE